ncbi:uncharacterized protein LOC106012084 [Aplysia californica]|uniref:Uncharacterized protein LOC106012084 n=1 Tax=Aplysia californica TaxID=6500 RepID=A0ABM1A240_APLCA|nr:uncharacterized protein LOC106012084 [Aplysia californica]
MNPKILIFCVAATLVVFSVVARAEEVRGDEEGGEEEEGGEVALPTEEEIEETIGEALKELNQARQVRQEDQVSLEKRGRWRKWRKKIWRKIKDAGKKYLLTQASKALSGKRSDEALTLEP